MRWHEDGADADGACAVELRRPVDREEVGCAAVFLALLPRERLPFPCGTIDPARLVRDVEMRRIHDIRLSCALGGGPHATSTVYVAYDYRVNDLTCWVHACYALGEGRPDGLGSFVRLLFDRYPLRKLFLKTTEEDVRDLARRTGFADELCLPSARWVRGAYRDEWYLGLERREGSW